MRRVSLPVGRRLFVAVAALAMLVVTLPARLAAGWLDLDEQGVAARELRGSVWSARAIEAQVGGLAVGDMDVGLHPLPLLAGRARLGFSGADEARGSVTVTRHTTGVALERLRLPLAGRFAALPVSALSFEDLRAVMRGGLCDSAEGLARVSLAGDPALGLPSTLSGNVRCEAGALTLPLTGASGAERLTLRLTQERVRAELRLAPTDPAAGARLAAMGFGRGDGGYTLAFDSAW